MKYTHNNHRQTNILFQFVMDACKNMCLQSQTEGEKVSKLSGYQQEKHQHLPTLQESPPVVAKDKRNTMSTYKLTSRQQDKPYDVVIFGASGSVGSFLVEEMALVVEKYYSSAESPQRSHITSSSEMRELRDPTKFAQNRRQSVPRHSGSIRWAVAGRSASRLSDCLCRAELSTGIKDLSSHVPVLLADLNHDRSLLELCSKTNLVINCVGPYTLGAELLIKACLEKGTNYIDLCHENTFIEWIRQEYSQAARAAQVYIINGCGFQSMSAEMGLNFAKQVVDGQIDEIKIIFNLNDPRAVIKTSPNEQLSKSSGIVSAGMWNSLLTEREQEQSKLPKTTTSTGRGSRREATKRPSEWDTSAPEGKQLLRQDTQSLVRDIVQLKNRDSLVWLQIISGLREAGRNFCLPTSGLTSEESQLTRGEMTNYELRAPDVAEGCWQPIRCSSFISMRSFSEVVLLSIWLLIFNVLVRFSPIRRLLKAFPYISSMGYVNTSNKEFQRESLSHIKFCQTFSVYGTPGDNSGDPLTKRDKDSRPKREQLLVTRIVGPEPNHVATATFAIQAAITLVMEADHLPSGGGVLTPGVAFADTNMIYQLRRRNIKFEIMKKA